MIQQLPYPPRVTDFTRPFWQGLREGELRTTRCLACGHHMFPPRFLCSRCWSEDVEWVRLRGTGLLRSYTEIWAAPRSFAADVPYVFGLVDLDEGLRCAARIRAGYDDLRPDLPVSFVPVPAEPEYLFAFVPTEPLSDAGGAAGS